MNFIRNASKITDGETVYHINLTSSTFNCYITYACESIQPDKKLFRSTHRYRVNDIVYVDRKYMQNTPHTISRLSPNGYYAGSKFFREKDIIKREKPVKHGAATHYSNELFSYNQCLARLEGRVLLINTNYLDCSATTHRHLVRWLTSNNIKYDRIRYINGVEIMR